MAGGNGGPSAGSGLGGTAAWRAYLLAASASVGAAALGLEVLAGRTMAPAIGTGSAVWASLLAVALGGLAAGNLLGGHLAGRLPAGGIVAWALPLAAAAITAFSLLYGPAMRWAAELPVVPGSLLAAALTQLLPMVLLGVVSPAILAGGSPGSPGGRWAGAVLAAGSAGGIAGALGVGLASLPAAGIARTFLLTAGVLALTSVPATLASRRWLAGGLAILVLAAAAAIWPSASQPATITQSQYGQIEVRQTSRGAVLLVDGLPQTGLEGPIQPWAGLRHGYLAEAALLMSDRPRLALVIGLGAGLAPRLLASHGLRCHSVEIDPAVVAVARRDFGFDGPVSVADGRAYMARTDAQWDVILLDVCTSERLPTHLFTVEAMQLARSRLSGGGVLAVQFIGDDGPWSAAVAATIRAVFPHCRLLEPAGWAPIGPQWVFASTRPLPPLPEGGDIRDGLPWRVWQPALGGQVITDDHCPAELAWARTAQHWRRLYATP